MTRILSISVILLIASAITVSAEPPTAFDAAAETMSRMRLVGAAIETHRINHGELPSADGKLRPVSSVLGSQAVELRDAWRTPLLYRANARSYEIISLGPDGRKSQDYDELALYPRRFAVIEESTPELDDIVYADGRFVRRPYADRRAAIETINAMNRLFVAAASFAIDNNTYPGETWTPAPVAELAGDLAIYLDEFPTVDGWGRPLLYTHYNGAFILASYGSDGEPDRTYYPDLPCGLRSLDVFPSAADGADIVMACGQLIQRPSGIE